MAASAAGAETDPLEARRAICMGWMMSAYPSGLEEGACTAEFDLPSPFLFACVRAQRTGFADATQREACRILFLRAAEKAGKGYVLN